MRVARSSPAGMSGCDGRRGGYWRGRGRGQRFFLFSFVFVFAAQSWGGRVFGLTTTIVVFAVFIHVMSYRTGRHVGGFVCAVSPPPGGCGVVVCLHVCAAVWGVCVLFHYMLGLCGCLCAYLFSLCLCVSVFISMFVTFVFRASFHVSDYRSGFL
jgi:hypothetical protein